MGHSDGANSSGKIASSQGTLCCTELTNRSRQLPASLCVRAVLKEQRNTVEPGYGEQVKEERVVRRYEERDEA